MKKHAIRHGDLALIKISKLPEDLVETKTNLLMAGSHGHNHTVNQGKIYLKKVNDFVFGYLVAKDSTIQHEEHGNHKIPDGVYELRGQQEVTHQGLKQVID